MSQRILPAILSVSLLVSLACTADTGVFESFTATPSPYDPSGGELTLTAGFVADTFTLDSLVEVQLLISTSTYSEVFGIVREISVPAATSSLDLNWAGLNNLGQSVFPGLYVATCSVQVLERGTGASRSLGGPVATIETQFLVK